MKRSNKHKSMFLLIKFIFNADHKQELELEQNFKLENTYSFDLGNLSIISSYDRSSKFLLSPGLDSGKQTRSLCISTKWWQVCTYYQLTADHMAQHKYSQERKHREEAHLCVVCSSDAVYESTIITKSSLGRFDESEFSSSSS